MYISYWNKNKMNLFKTCSNFRSLSFISTTCFFFQKMFSGTSSTMNWTMQGSKLSNYIWSSYIPVQQKESSYTKRPNEKATTKTFCNTKTYKNEKKWKTWEYHVRYFDTHAWLMTLNQKSFSKIWSLHL